MEGSSATKGGFGWMFVDGSGAGITPLWAGPASTARERSTPKDATSPQVRFRTFERRSSEPRTSVQPLTSRDLGRGRVMAAQGDNGCQTTRVVERPEAQEAAPGPRTTATSDSGTSTPSSPRYAIRSGRPVAAWTASALIRIRLGAGRHPMRGGQSAPAAGRDLSENGQERRRPVRSQMTSSSPEPRFSSECELSKARFS